jgi:LPS sulfotransferase NodH
MRPSRITPPFSKRVVHSLKDPKDFCWKVQRAYQQICRNTYACTLAPLVAKESKGSVVMLHLGRSGSTVLGDLLDQHPDIFWDGEIYHHEAQKCKFSRREDAAFDPFRIFEMRRCRSGRAYYGFESKTSDQRFMNCSVNAFICGLKERNVQKTILLKRKNLLRIAASFQLAYKKQSYHVWRYEKPDFHKIQLMELDIGMGIKKPLLAQLEEWTRGLQNLAEALQGSDVLELVYEHDIENDPLVALHKVTDFLGLPPAGNPIVNLKKSTPFPLRSFVEDYNQVGTILRGTPYEHLLDT